MDGRVLVVSNTQRMLYDITVVQGCRRRGIAGDEIVMEKERAASLLK